MHDPFPLPCQGRNANHQDLSFQTFKKVLPSFEKLIFIIAHQYEIIDIEDSEKFDISDLRNVHAKVRITPHKLDVCKKKRLTFGYKPLDIVSTRTMICETYI